MATTGSSALGTVAHALFSPRNDKRRAGRRTRGGSAPKRRRGRRSRA